MSICERLVQGLSDYFVLLTSVRDDLVTDDGNQVLSARQGMVLKNLVDSLDPELVKGLASKEWVKMYIKQPFTLSLSVDNPFVTDGESFTLSATLLNSEGVGVYGEEVVLTGSDGSVYYGITNELGVINFNISSISSDTTFTASYNNLTSEILIECCLWYDSIGDLTKYKSQACELTKNGNIIESSYTTGNSFFIAPNSSEYSDFEVIYEAKTNIATTNIMARIGTSPTITQYDGTTTVQLTDTDWHTVKIRCTNGVYQAFLDNVQVGEDISVTYQDYYYKNASYKSSSTTRVFSIRNMRIKAL